MKKTILISGCSSGIGRSLALALGRMGHTVYAGARKIADVENMGMNVIPVTLDVNDETHIQEVMAKINLEQGSLDILINNAGYGAMGPLAEVPIAQVKSQFETNVFAPLAMAQAALPLLREKSKLHQNSAGLVVNIGSSAGLFTLPFSGVYGASKAAIHALSDVFRMEMASLNVHVMTVYPGGVASTFGDTASAKLKDTLIKNSLYSPILPAIEKRARISSSSPTTPDMFAARLIKAMLSDRPPAECRIGQGSQLLPWAKKLLPTKLRELILRKAYQLTHLKLEKRA